MWLKDVILCFAHLVAAPLYNAGRLTWVVLAKRAIKRVCMCNLLWDLFCEIASHDKSPVTTLTANCPIVSNNVMAAAAALRLGRCMCTSLHGS